jgi:hypothetical protein
MKAHCLDRRTGLMTSEPKDDYNFRVPASFESEVLSILAFEFSTSQHAESDRRIKRRLRDKKLGPYDATRVANLRALKDDVQMEVSTGWQKSRFYKSLGGAYAALGDWRLKPFARHLARRHSQISPVAITRFLPYAIFLYYLR